jgi:hypothetical protein
MDTGLNENSNIQIPKKPLPIIGQMPNSNRSPLELDVSLEFGAWILELLPSHPRNLRHPPQCCRATYLTIQPFNKSRFVTSVSICVHLWLNIPGLLPIIGSVVKI